MKIPFGGVIKKTGLLMDISNTLDSAELFLRYDNVEKFFLVKISNNSIELDYRLSPDDKERIEGIIKNTFRAIDVKMSESVSVKDGGGIDGSTVLAIDSQRKDLGGIDLRALPMNVEPMAVNSAISWQAGVNAVSAKDLDKQWLDVLAKIAKGPMPYKEIKEYVAACCSSKDCSQQKEAVCSWLLNILKLEEEAAVATAPQMKQILALAAA
jgi:hypothetical protein